ncbi:MAG: hypothetical protein NE334_14245 [Lentisphaeraceae bacterium]|nr:hypothetical protein [Lentisphaeraceae bacterium]
MSKGLKLAIGILAFGCMIPLITAFLTLRKKPIYHTRTLPFKGSFVQLTWQEKPEANLEHILIFREKPELYQASSGLDIRPPEDIAGYVVYPRGVFYDNAPLLKPVQKVLKRQKVDVRTWFLEKGKAFPAKLLPQHLDQLKEIVATLRDHNITEEQLIELVTSKPAWLALTSQFSEFKEKLENGKIDLTPRKRRSEFMNF